MLMWPFKNTLDLLKYSFHTTNNHRVPFYFYHNTKLTEIKYFNLSHMKLPIFWYLLKYRKGKFIWFNPINACVLVAWSYPTVCDLMDCSLPVSSVHGILQARILEPFPSLGIFLTQDWTWVSCITGRFLTVWATREAPMPVVDTIKCCPVVPSKKDLLPLLQHIL